MPQAADAVRSLMRDWFGSIDLYEPMEFLLSHGYTNDDNGIIRAPTRSHTVSADEDQCIMFLCDEWDYDFRTDR